MYIRTTLSATSFLSSLPYAAYLLNVCQQQLQAAGTAASRMDILVRVALEHIWLGLCWLVASPSFAAVLGIAPSHMVNCLLEHLHGTLFFEAVAFSF